MKKMISLALCAALLVCMTACGGSSGDESTGADSTAAVSTLAAAQYPETLSYPDEDNWDDDAWNDWWAERQERRAYQEDYPEGYRTFVASTMAQFLASDGENMTYSPLNLYLALAMLAETTGGSSQAQLLDLLGADSADTLRTQANALWLGNYLDDGTTTCLLGSSLWLNEAVSYRQDTLDILTGSYYASVFQGEMGSDAVDQALQSWLNEQTGSLLEEQAGNVTLSAETVLALATTIYYRAAWTSEFQAESTTEDTFHGANGDVTCDFMHQVMETDYFRGDQFGAVCRELENSGSMWLVLPDEGVAVSDLLTDSQVLDLLEAGWEWEDADYYRVNLSMPKFDVAASLDLTDGLEALGVTDVFDAAAADFSPLTGDTDAVLSAASHSARVTVDEEGVEAAAFTVLAVSGTAAATEEIDFTLDRPFLFFITSDTNTILFAGVVNQPNG